MRSRKTKIHAGGKLMSDVKRVSVQDLKKLLDSGIQVIDVRLPYDYFSGRIPGSRNVPGTSIAGHVGQMPAGLPLVFVCDDGRRSEQVAIAAQTAGFTDVTVLDGGMDAWLDAAFPTETISDGMGPAMTPPAPAAPDAGR
jgi:thiosulfate sulfurtransferase